MKPESYLGRCARDHKEAEAIIARLESQGVPFQKILDSIREKAKSAEKRLNNG